jgi:cell division protein FtsN
MDRDYKPNTMKQPEKKNNLFLNGLILGLLVGVVVAIGVTVWIKGGPSAFINKTEPAPTIEATAPEKTPDATPDKSASAPEENKDRFEFYNILPGAESKVTEREIKQLQDDNKPKDTFYLQVGAFQTVQEADNQKAKLALLGVEAVVQTINLPDKGTLHRVRVGPFNDINQITKAKSELAQNGFNADLIKMSGNQP